MKSSTTANDTLMPFTPNANKFFELKVPAVQPQSVLTPPIEVSTVPETPELPAPVPTSTLESFCPSPVTGPVGVAQLPVSPVVPQPLQPSVIPAPVIAPPQVVVVTPAPVVVPPDVVPDTGTSVDLFALILGVANDVKLVRYPKSSEAGEGRAFAELYVNITVEIWAVIRVVVTGMVRGELNLDQIKLLAANRSISMYENSTAEIKLTYKDDQTVMVAVTGQHDEAQTLIDQVQRFAAAYQEELQQAAEDNQNNRIYRRFIEVLEKESTAVCQWLSKFPVGLLQ